MVKKGQPNRKSLLWWKLDHSPNADFTRIRPRKSEKSIDCIRGRRSVCRNASLNYRWRYGRKELNPTRAKHAKEHLADNLFGREDEHVPACQFNLSHQLLHQL